MGPKETMTRFRDFGSDALDPEQWRANKLFTDCNWVQAMEGNIDTSHISWLHQFHAVADWEDDGTDRPGYPSQANSIRFWRHDRAPRLEVQDEWYGFRYAGLRTTPNGHTHARVTAYVVPWTTVVSSIPIATGGGVFIPRDDYTTWRYNFAVKPPLPDMQKLMGGNLFGMMPYEFSGRQGGIIQRELTKENDYLVDRDAQRNVSFSGLKEFVSQDRMVTESMGPLFDRSQEHLGTTDKAVIKMRQMLIKAARDLEEHGTAPPASDPDKPYNRIFSAEKVLAAGEDWRILGTADDPIFHQTQEERIAAGPRRRNDHALPCRPRR
jgi:hypothetical protein